ncbi:glycosyltransferase family 2 protein [Selenomonas ruminantium]|uniref:glycosyltransferase family 2 protein n=1 Tax=Selenomonas ruminantium TaxID=971 RepID=UPI00047B9559|nr:glycosyltransferase [Selenomonas ruminantium]
MTEKPKLTIIVPMYNRQAYIKDCLASIQRQTYTDWELLLVDDASTDETAAICRDWQRADERIKLLEQPHNQGVSAARNIGLQAAGGKYVTFVDSDDYLLPDGLAHMMKIALAGQADVVWSPGRYYEDAEGQTLIPEIDCGMRSKAVESLDVDLGKRLNLFFQYNGWVWSVWNRVYRREFLEQNKLKFEAISTNEDALFNLLCLCRAKKYMVTNQLYYVYRLSGDSILREAKTLDNLEKHVQDTFRLAEILWRNLGEITYFSEHPEIKEQVMERITGYMLVMPCRWGFVPTPLEHQQLVKESIREALEQDFGGKAWLVQFLYRHFLEIQGCGKK